MLLANGTEMAKATEFRRLQQSFIVDNSCETLWDRVLRMCDQWFPSSESKAMTMNSCTLEEYLPVR
jgi:hypothetical protein